MGDNFIQSIGIPTPPPPFHRCKQLRYRFVSAADVHLSNEKNTHSGRGVLFTRPPNTKKSLNSCNEGKMPNNDVNNHKVKWDYKTRISL